MDARLSTIETSQIYLFPKNGTWHGEVFGCYNCTPWVVDFEIPAELPAQEACELVSGANPECPWVDYFLTAEAWERDSEG